ncbi:MAG TPA: hypothetical protein VHG51_04140 [Longimicrobiaceae bacterium]|nr:hypothetical protein [Longimicrobiaceae bacterium]
MRDGPRYDRGYRRPGRPRGYGADFRRGYDRGWGGGYAPTFAGASFPMGPAYMPMAWGWYGPFGAGVDPFPYGPPVAPPGFGVPERPPRRPEESPAYGRGGDRELLRWARERGYDVGYAIEPRDPRRHW